MHVLALGELTGGGKLAGHHGLVAAAGSALAGRIGASEPLANSPFLWAS